MNENVYLIITCFLAGLLGHNIKSLFRYYALKFKWRWALRLMRIDAKANSISLMPMSDLYATHEFLDAKRRQGLSLGADELAIESLELMKHCVASEMLRRALSFSYPYYTDEDRVEGKVNVKEVKGDSK